MGCFCRFCFYFLFCFFTEFFEKSVSSECDRKCLKTQQPESWRVCRRKYRFSLDTTRTADHRAIRTGEEKSRAPYCVL